MTNIFNEVKKTNCDCASYTGTVTVSAYLGDRLIQSETSHNSGMDTLFEFIGNCLQGNWIVAKYNRPCKLVLLKEGESDEGKPIQSPLINNTNSFDTNGYHFWSSKYAVCSPMLYDNAAYAELTSGTTPSGSVTYHFRVPFLNLVGGSAIKKLLLLPLTPSDYVKDACAYYVLENAIKVPLQSGNFTVIIDWTLTFTNAGNAGGN